MSTETKARYENGKVYKLVSDHTDNNYIGSTCLTLPKRMYIHRCHYKTWQDGKFSTLTSFELMKLGNVEIVLIEDYPQCQNKNQLHARERYWIEQCKDTCLNKVIPTRTQKEYRQIPAIKDKAKLWSVKYLYLSMRSVSLNPFFYPSLK